jgi:4-alpha-glucanotransferase
VSDEAVLDLARRAGIAVDWTDAAGEPRRVAPAVLRRILDALELPCDTRAQLATSRDRFAATDDTLPPLITAEVATCRISSPIPRGSPGATPPARC